MKKMMAFSVALLLVALRAGCNRDQQDINAAAHPVHVDTFMSKRMENELLTFRQRKDEQFKAASDSPIPAELRPAFRKLEYYPINWKYRFEGPVNRYPNPEKFTMIATNGEK